MRDIKQNLEFYILIIGTCFSIALFFLAPPAHSVIIKDDQFYNADTLLPVEIHGMLYFQGGMSIDTISGGGWQGDYPLYMYIPSPNWIYSLSVTAIIVTILSVYRYYKS